MQGARALEASGDRDLPDLTPGGFTALIFRKDLGARDGCKPEDGRDAPVERLPQARPRGPGLPGTPGGRARLNLRCRPSVEVVAPLEEEPQGDISSCGRGEARDDEHDRLHDA